MHMSLRAHNQLQAGPAGRKANHDHPQPTVRQPCTPSCSYTVQPRSTSRSTSTSLRRHNYISPARLAVVTHAWFGSQPTRQLWDYQGSYVRKLGLQELQLLHRLSFGHRNQRSYLIVLHQPDSGACQAIEQQVERLASGLRHERAFVAAALDVSSADAAGFAANMLGVNSLPAVLFYPEGARGTLKFLGPDMSAPGMLTAINSARRAALPATSDRPGAAEWQLLEAATPLAVTALRAAAATGDREAVVASLQQHMKPVQPTPLAAAQTGGYWSQGRVMFWGGVMLCSLLFIAWDLKLADAWEDWCLARRQAARTQGKKFTMQQNMDDVLGLVMTGLQQSMAETLSTSGAQQQEQQQQQQDSIGQAGRKQQEGDGIGARLQPEQRQQQEQLNGGFAAAGQQEDSQRQQQQRQRQQGKSHDLDLKQQDGAWVLDQPPQG